MTEVHQLLPDLGYRSAISFHEFGTRRALDAAGFRGTIWAEEVSPEYRRLASNASVFATTRSARRGDGVLLYSCSTGSRGLADEVAARREPKLMYFHNITPAEYFEPYDAGAAVACARGRDELRHVAASVRVAMANSEFSAAELRGLGIADVRVVYPYLQPGLEAAPSASHRRYLRTSKRGIDLLFVSRIVPHKGHLHLLRAFAALRDTIDPHARLFVVGAWGPDAYMRTLFRQRDRLGGDGVVFTGSIDEAHLAAHYREADLYLCMSEHEGFGVPLLEAMEQDMPVVAYDTGAVAEAMGGSGVLLRTLDPCVAAEVVARVATDESLRVKLVERQRRRLAEVAAAPRDAAIVDAVRTVIDGA